MQRRNHISWTSFVSVCLTVLFAFGSSLWAVEEKSETPAKTYWKITGQLEEACKCDAACPCWFGSKPTHMNCGGQLVYFITKGKYGDVPLDALSFARVGQSPDGQTMMGAYGNWDFDYLYVDEKANDQQRKALEDIAWQIQPSASKKMKTLYVPISRKMEGKQHQVSIGSVGTFSAHLLEGGLGGVPKIMNPPGADPIRKQYEQGRTDRFEYTDAAQNWNSTNSNYMYTEFTVDSVQYGKYGAMMMQKMEEMKKQKAEQRK